ncbi:MAG: immunoglobulin domain-containing protein [Verrucomicrobiae bacterium]|nr:immunoglobulin domain-containing protein [Verrucomicrobiae bacterium]
MPFSRALTTLGLLGILAGSIPADAQNQAAILLANRVPGLLDAPVFDTDGITRLEGDAFLAQAYVSPFGVMGYFETGPPPGHWLVPFGNPVPFGTGPDAGYLAVGHGSAVALPYPIGAPVVVELRVWEAAKGRSFEAAAAARSKVGVSDQLYGLGPLSGLSSPSPLRGLKSFHLWPDGRVRSAIIRPLNTSPADLGGHWSFRLDSSGIHEPVEVTWFKDGAALPGPGGPVLVLDPVQYEHAGWYTAQYRFAGHVKMTPPVQLTVIARTTIASVILTPPEPLPGQPFRAEVTTSGASPLTFAWYHNNVRLQGEFGPSLQVNAARVGLYRVVAHGPQNLAGRDILQLEGPHRVNWPLSDPGGNVSIEPYSGFGYLTGDTVHLLARPNPGYDFIGWHGDYEGTANPATLVVDANKFVTPMYRPAGGTVVLSSHVAGQVNALATDGQGNPLHSNYVGQFHGGPAESAPVPIGPILPFGGGYVFGHAQVLPGIARGEPIVLRLRAWLASAGSWETARSIGSGFGESPPVTVITGGTGLPPEPAAVLSGLRSFTLATLPRIFTAPVSAQVRRGAEYTFHVHATGSAPMTYQWRKDGTPIPGATQSTLTLPSVQDADVGQYSVSVSNQVGAVQSAPAGLSIAELPVIVSVHFDREPQPRHALRMEVVIAGTGPFAYLWLRDGINFGEANWSPVLHLADARPGTYRIEVTNPAGTVGHDAVTIPPWYRIETVVQGNGRVAVDPDLTLHPGGSEVRLEALDSFDQRFVGWSGDVTGANPVATVVMNADRRIVALFGAVGGTFFAVNRLPGTSLDAPVFDADGTTPLAGDAYAGQFYAGPSPDDLLPVGEPHAFRSGANAGYLQSSSPRIPTVPEGATAWVQLRAWDRTAAATYEAALAVGARCGASTVIAVRTGGDGQPPSLPAPPMGLESFRIAPATPPAWIIPLGPMEVAAGASLRWTVEADGSAPLDYRWFRNGVPLASHRGPVLELSAVEPADQGAYSVRVANPLGVIESGPVALTVIEPRRIVSQSGPLTVAFGASALLHVQAEGRPPLAFQWFQGLPSDTSRPVGDDSDTFATGPLTQSTPYWVRVTDSFGSTDSDPIEVTVLPRPAVFELAGIVFEDRNGNGIRDPDEPGLADVPVRLVGDPGVPEQRTDEAGGFLFTGLPAGIHTLEIAQVPGLNHTTDPVRILTGVDGEQLWITAGQRATPGHHEFVLWTWSHTLPPGLDGPLDDPDGDGAVNLVEFARGTDPRVPDEPEPARGAIVTEGDSRFAGLLLQRAHAAAGVRFEVERSRDLIGWEAVPARETILEQGATTDRILLQDPLALPPIDVRFLRLRLSLER